VRRVFSFKGEGGRRKTEGHLGLTSLSQRLLGLFISLLPAPPPPRRPIFPQLPSSPAPQLLLLAAVLLLSCTSVPKQLPATSARWVSLSPSMTEVLFAVGAGPEVAGVCAPASFPPEAGRLPVVASWEQLDVERILALRPRTCFTVEGMQAPQGLASLRRLGVEVVQYPVRSLDDLWACIEDTGRRTGHAEQGRALAGALRERAARAVAGRSGPARRALVVVGLDPLVAAGPRTFISDVLRAGGYVNALQGGGDAYPVLSLESLAAADPEVLVFPEGELSVASCDALTDRATSLTHHRVQGVTIPADLLVRPGPRTVEAVERLAAAGGHDGGGAP
jgi:iron complex transport system substrate-binding protein